MNNQDRFKELFKEHFEDDIYDFLHDFEDDKNPLNLELVETNDAVKYDSYGNEDSKLERVFRSNDLDLYIKFKGTRCSYQGEEWDEYQFVEQKQKTITYFG